MRQVLSRFCVLVLAVAVLSSCASVASRAVLTGSINQAQGIVCASDLGDYMLPKGVLTIVVTKGNPSTLDAAVARRGDKFHHYCLDHLKSPLAAERVTVVKTPMEAGKLRATPFLEAIYSTSIDESATILKKIIETTFKVLADTGGNREGFADLPQKLELEIDPFDRAQLDARNVQLSEYGFCLVVGGYTYNEEVTDAGTYCDDPHRAAVAPKLTVALQQAPLVAERVKGIYIRPRASYTLFVYTGGRGNWFLAKTQNLDMENLSPIIALGLDRAAFTTVKTAMLFDQGNLEKVCFEKGSEALGFVGIPVQIVEGIINLPRKTYEATVLRNNGRISLLQARERLLATQEAYIEYEARKLSNPTLPNGPLKDTIAAEGAMPTVSTTFTTAFTQRTTIQELQTDITCETARVAQ